MEYNQNNAHNPQHTGYPVNNAPASNTPQNPPASHSPAYARPTTERTPVIEKIEQLLIFTYFFIAAILVFRFVLGLFGGNKTSPFVDFVFQLTTPFMLPFEGIFGKPALSKYTLDFNILIGLVVYALIFFGLSRLVRIVFK